ncbi:MAG: DUF2285 domain-containing protein [Alphaproteobacteria bacterium]|nr:DUF2285 domain-containing protein [Alphaproteobacteria bacterium]
MPDRARRPMLADSAPSEDRLTEYDQAHLPEYLRLLDADRDAAPWTEVVHIVLGIDPRNEPERARRAYDSHLARARWIADHGYHDILRRS